jgi:hypothetical protein
MSISDKPANKILIIGGSTHNPCTPSRIRDALLETSFLEEWTVIFVNHAYYSLNDAKVTTKEFESHISHQFWGLNLVFIKALETYPLKKSYIYIVPDTLPTPLTVESCCDDWIYTIAKDREGCPEIRASDELSHDNNNEDSFDIKVYSPNIDQVMTEISQSQSRNQLTSVAGLLVCGKGNDGARGLSDIKKIGGSTAVQIPDECYNPKMTNTDSMPRRALELEPNHTVVSLEYSPNSYTLTNWLQSIK